MAIAYSNSTAYSYNGNHNSTTFSHTCSGNDRILFVCIQMGGLYVTGVTYNGVTMTNLFNTPFGVTPKGFILYYLMNPPVGTYNVVITLDSFHNIYEEDIAISYTGVKQVESSNIGGSNLPYSSVSITTQKDFCWVLLFMGCNGGTLSAGTDTTMRQKISASPLSFDCAIFDSNSPVLPAGSKTLNVNIGTANQGEYIMLAIEAVPLETPLPTFFK